MTTYWGEHIQPNKITAHDLSPYNRKRIKPRSGSGTDSWYRYDKSINNRKIFENISKQVIRDLVKHAIPYWDKEKA